MDRTQEEIRVNDNVYTWNCYTTRTRYATTEHAEIYKNGRFETTGSDKWLNRPWYCYQYQNAMRNAVNSLIEQARYEFATTKGYKKMTAQRVDEFKKTAEYLELEYLLKYIDDTTREHDEADKWLNAFKKDYDALSETTKEHLKNADINITSKEQAETVMGISKAFDLLFRMEEQAEKQQAEKAEEK